MATTILIVIDGLLKLFAFVIIAYAIMSWLTAFNVLNPHQPIVRQASYFLESAVRPLLWPIRRFIPPLGGVDLSPIIMLLIIVGIQAGVMKMLWRTLPPVFG